jgi:hypothetical protein
MPTLNHTKADAIFEIDGLALLRFHKPNPDDMKTWKWQVGFLRDTDHALKLTVAKIHRRSGTDKPSYLIRQTETLSEYTRLISFSVEDGSYEYNTYPDGYWHEKDVTFNRMQKCNHPEDFRWVPDLENEIHQSQEVELRGRLELPSKLGFTLTEIPGAIFYNTTPSDTMLRKGIQGDSYDKAYDFGYANNRVKGDLKFNGKLSLAIPDEETLILPKETDYYYLIKLENLNKSNVPVSASLAEGDLSKYYGILKTKGIITQKYTNWGLPEIKEEAAGRTDCHVFTTKGVDIGDLSSLI